MTVYKCYYLWNNKKIYLKRRDSTDIFVSLKGLKASITQIEKYKKLCQRENYKKDTYYVETYSLTLDSVKELEGEK